MFHRQNLKKFSGVEKKHAFNYFVLVLEQNLSVLKLLNSDDLQKIKKIKTQLLIFEEHVRENQTSLLKLDDFHVEAGEKWSKSASELSVSMRYILISVALVTLVAAMLIAMKIANSINSILQDVASRLKDRLFMVKVRSTRTF